MGSFTLHLGKLPKTIILDDFAALTHVLDVFGSFPYDFSLYIQSYPFALKGSLNYILSQ